MTAKRQGRRAIAAAELMEELRRDPAWVARDEAKERERQKRVEASLAEQKPMLNDLSSVGINVRSISDLVNTSQRYPAAIPVLMKHLLLPYKFWTRNFIARALTVREAEGIACRVLLDEFKKTNSSSPDESEFKWALANALSVTADESVLDELIELAADRRHGGARDGIVRALARFPRNERVVDVLIGVLSDESVAGHAVMALGKLKAKKAEPYLERLLSHPQAWVRKEAVKALKSVRRPVSA